MHQLLAKSTNADDVGDDLANPVPTLVSLPGATGPVTQVAAGEGHSLAVMSTGQLYSFGDDERGELGFTSASPRANPTPTLVSLPEAAGPVTQVAAGQEDSFALTSSGQLYAFGANVWGQLGIATNVRTYNSTPPTLVSLPGATGPITQVAAGDQHTLALTATGQVYSMGHKQQWPAWNCHQQRERRTELDPHARASATGEWPGHAGRGR